jgi:hypothetical protein
MEPIGQGTLLMPVTMVMMIGAMISDKDDQAASSCSGQLLGGRDHMLGVDANAPSRILGVGTHTQRNTSGKSSATGRQGKCVFSLLPITAATNRLSTAARGNWQDCASPPPATAIIAYMLLPPSHTRRPSRAEENVSVCGWHVVVSRR